MNQLLEAALRYAEYGYQVFPCRPGTKKPLTEHGVLDATCDADQIELWWSRWPDANIGLATNGLLVVDVDGAKNSWLANQPDKSTQLALGAMAITPRGGCHYIFRQPTNSDWRCTESKLAPKVDTRANGGYIVVAPSVLTGDRHYCWAPGMVLEAPTDLPEPPQWLVTNLDNLTAGKVELSYPGNIIPLGQRNGTLARLAGSMRRVGMGQAEIFAAILQTNNDRCVPPLPEAEVERIAKSVARYKPDEVSVAIAENHYAQMYDRPIDTDGSADPGPLPLELLSVPGFVNQVRDYMLETAPYPEPVLAFCGALSLQAVLAGRKVRDPSDNRTNLYVLGLANSGAGKDYPRKVNQRILLAAGLAQSIGDTFASGEGIEDRLFINPTVLFQTDEIDGLMMAINRGKDVRHEGIMNTLLKMYTSANAIYPMRVKAGKKQADVIDQPGLCIFGTAIPKHFYESLSVKMLTNGFFARMIVMEAGKRASGQDAEVTDTPSAVIEVAQWWADYLPGRNLGVWHPVPQVVPITANAESVLRELREHADLEYSIAEDGGDVPGMAIWARANEKARRLALIYACSERHDQPEVDEKAARWAWNFVDHQTRRMLYMASEHVSENEFHARCKRVLAVLREWQEKKGDQPMPYWALNRQLPWSARDHEEVRMTLVNQKLISYEERKTGGPPQKLYKLG